MTPYISAGILLSGVFAAIAYRRKRQRAMDTAGRRLGSDLVAGGALYGVAAPPIGGAGVVMGLTAATRDPETLLMLVYALPWFYIFGFVPALLCGVVAGALRPAHPSWRACAGMALVGAVYGFVFLVGFISHNRPWQEELGFPLTVGAAPGAVSAFLCARLFYGRPGGRGASGGNAPQSAMQ
ncbi:hypothetical protein [Achromobacter insolitus]|jgi:hypothetical protein|uniref:Uncharacterized protein n=1 Tax=Achromobacter insolitus TaxID=217204 RepID=A0A6S7EY05_9BURK|nr:hypothetical protein [Achromobacter insolitus]OAD16546.1 hypothetical protein A3839_27545 [Achromobacter insolitus]QEK91372.1 hypothetical protein E2544_05865 [Achromobacter insolitus]CAB3930404.1 hypothetical protein LMG6000_01458 [Achromobacter insolitus]CAB3933560.1 hypothetical protein LMG5997_01346 [Achromobacter insolitus]